MGLSAVTYSGTPAPGSGGVYREDVSVFPTAGGAYLHEFLTLIVQEAPAFTSASQVTLQPGAATSFQVKTFGYPAPTLSLTGTLPPGLSFTPATGLIGGAIQANSGGAYKVVITAKNAIGPDATQTLTISVNQAPVFTSVATATFTAGQSNSFTVTTTGYPGVHLQQSNFGASGRPGGVAFSGDTTTNSGKLSGNPAIASLGEFTWDFIADTGNAQATQNFTLFIKGGPTIAWNPAPLLFGNPLGAGQLNATAALQGVGAVPGTFVYSPPAGTILTPGNQLVTVTFTPTDSTKFFVESEQVQVNVTFSPTLPFALTATPVFSRDAGNNLIATVTVANTGSSSVDHVVLTAAPAMGPLQPVAISPATLDLGTLGSGNTATFVLTYPSDLVGLAIGPSGTPTTFSFSAEYISGSNPPGPINASVNLNLP